MLRKSTPSAQCHCVGGIWILGMAAEMGLTGLMLANAGGEHPIIDIDGTVFLQFALFLVLYVVCRKYLFLPYLALKERRAAQTDQAELQATDMEKRAAAILAEYNQELGRLHGQMDAARARHFKELQVAQQNLIEQARQTIAQEKELSLASLRADVDATQRDLAGKTEGFVRLAVQRLLGREVRS